MITSIYSGGGIGNQLIYTTNLLATAYENNINFKNIAFKAERYFKVDLKKINCKNEWAGRKTIFLQKYVNLCLRLGIKPFGVKCFIDDYNSMKEYLKQGDGTVYCWPYYDFINLYKNQQIIREAIVLKEKYRSVIDDEFNSLKQEKNTIIGVHIRHSDYKYWLGGRYYYDYEIYMKCLLSVEKQINNCIFVIFSDEDIPTNIYKYDLKLYIPKNSSEIFDLIFLSKCDYIIGPPSTFSGWASFYGNVPKYTIFSEEDINKGVNISDFGVYMIDYIDDKMDEGEKIKQKIIEGKLVE